MSRAGSRLGRVAVAIAATAAVGAMAPGAASAGTIVYQHANDLWVMNDDGTNQRPLLTAQQVGAASLSWPSVDPTSGNLSFVADTPASDGVCSAYCDGVYSLVDNKITRLSPPPSDCTAINFACGSDDDDPSTSADGRSVFTYSSYVNNGFGSVASEALDVSPLNGSNAPTAWPLPSGGSTPLSNQETENDFSVTAADPVNANDIAYVGSGYCVNVNNDTGCEEGLVVEDSVTSANTHIVSYDDEPEQGMAFSTDGSHLADIEVGNYRGIWIYTNNDVNAASASTAWHGWYVLADPLQDSNDGSNADQTTFTSLTVTGAGALVFDNGTNVYEVPSGCWGTSVGERGSSTSTTPVPDCGTFGPNNSHVIQLTTDGTTGAVDAHPTWASVAVAPYVPPAPSTTASTSGGGSSTPGTPGSGTPSGSGAGSRTGGSSGTHGSGPPAPLLPAVQSVLLSGPGTSLKGITLDVKLNESSAVTVTIELVTRKATRKKKAKLRFIGTVTFTGAAGLNTLKIKKVAGHRLAKGKYRAIVSVAGGTSQMVPFAIRR